MTRWVKALAAVLVLALSAAGCSPEAEQASPTDGTGGDRLAPQVASYDLAVGSQRFMVGLLTQEAGLVGGGEVSLKFAYLGTREEETTGEVVAEATATYLPIPAEAGGAPPEVPDRPSAISAPTGTGVYSAEVSFDRAGFWGVVIEADLEGEGPVVGRTTFEVAETHRYPSIGEDAPLSENHTIHSAEVPPAAVDSRARDGRDIPDPELHSMTVAQAVASGLPTVLVVSTPTYCVSRFCGPITDMVHDLSGDYSGVANFVHIEVWRDFEAQEVNRAAAEWVLREQNILEPWVFLIGPDGKISGRWDNVATRGEIEPVLTTLISR